MSNKYVDEIEQTVWAKIMEMECEISTEELHKLITKQILQAQLDVVKEIEETICGSDFLPTSKTCSRGTKSGVPWFDITLLRGKINKLKQDLGGK